MPPAPKLIYISRSRLHRNRANLIQTLHTAAALRDIGVDISLYMPPWRGRIRPDARLREMGLSGELPIRSVQLLHRRWPVQPFVTLYARHLRRADAVYLRSVDLSLALARADVRHHLELHTLRDLAAPGLMQSVIEHHRGGRIDRLIPISRAAANALIEEGADPARVHVSPSGVDAAAFDAVSPFDAAELEHPRAVYLGRVSVTRGLRILEAVAASEAATVTIIGDREDAVPDRPGLCWRPAVAHREVPALYDDADIVLLPYQKSLGHADSISPLKLFEAMAAGRPIVASDIPPIREVLAHEQNAILAPPEDTEAWVAAVQRLRSEPELAVGLARRARQDVTSRYTWRRRAEGIARCLGWEANLPAMHATSGTAEG